MKTENPQYHITNWFLYDIGSQLYFMDGQRKFKNISSRAKWTPLLGQFYVGLFQRWSKGRTTLVGRLDLPSGPLRLRTLLYDLWCIWRRTILVCIFGGVIPTVPWTYSQFQRLDTVDSEEFLFYLDSYSTLNLQPIPKVRYSGQWGIFILSGFLQYPEPTANSKG